MTPQERLVVTSQLGLDHADEVLDAIVKRSGHEASPTLVAMIERAQMKGTTHLPALIADLRDPRKRTERLRQGAQAVVEEALAGAPEPVPAGAEAGGGRSETGAAGHVVAAPVTPVAPVAPAPPPVVLEVAPEPVPVRRRLLRRPWLPRLRSRRHPRSRHRRRLPRGGWRMTASRGSWPGPRRSPPGFTSSGGIWRTTKGLPADGLRSVVEAFPDGWARRRALVELLRNGSPAALGDALGLLEILGSERDRLWCLGTLAENRRALNSQDRETLLAAAPSPTARRRLERRLG